MSGSAVLDTALGVIFVFLMASLVASGIVEWLSNKLNMRGEYLLRGLREMLDVPPAAPVGAARTPAGEGLLADGSLRENLNRMAEAGATLADELTPPEMRSDTTEAAASGAPATRPPEDVDLVDDLTTPETRAAADAAAADAAAAEAASGARPAPEEVNLVDDLTLPPLPDPEADPVTGEPVPPPEPSEPEPSPSEPVPSEPQQPTAAQRRPWLADLLMAHPVVASLHRPERPAQPGARGWGWRKRDMHLTSYLSAQTFARALLDMFTAEGDGETAVDRVRARVEALDPAVPGRGALLALIRESEGDLERLRRSIEHWFDEQMGRVSGWYKRWAQWRLFVVGGLLAVVANISTVAVAQSLYVDQPLRQAVVAQAQAGQLCESAPDSDLSCERRQLGVLRDLSLPVGWHPSQAVADCRAGNGGEACGWLPGPWLSWAWDSLQAAGVVGVLLRLLGWLFTAAAVSFGAPFWFDALSKLGSLRTAGRPPARAPAG